MESASDFIKAIIEVSHVGFGSYDLRKDQLNFSSNLAQKILGYSPEEHQRLSRHFFEKIIHPDDQERIHQVIEELKRAQDGEIVSSLIRYLRADGHYVWIYIRRIISERDSEGQSLTVAGVLQDVTEHVDIQEKLRESIRTLEDISYKNSHEIRSLVATILGLTNLIDEKSLLHDFDQGYFHHLKLVVKKLDQVIYEINDGANKATTGSHHALGKKSLG